MNGNYHEIVKQPKMTKPAGATNTNGLLTTNVRTSNEAAMSNTITPHAGAGLSHPSKVVLPHVRRYTEEELSRLDPFLQMLHRERREMLYRFKLALEAAGVEYVEADHE